MSRIDFGTAGTPSLPKWKQRFPFHSARPRVKIQTSYEETGFNTSRTASPEIAALFQGFNPVQTFQSAHVFPRARLESAAHAAHRTITPPDFPETFARTGCHHLDWPRIVSDPVHEPECFD